MFTAKGLYGHIRNNNVKSAVLLAAFPLLVLALWFVCCLLWIGLSTKFQPIIMRLAGQHPTFEQLWQLTLARTVELSLSYAFVPICLVPVWFAVAFLSHRAIIRAATGAQRITRRLEPELYNQVETSRDRRRLADAGGGDHRERRPQRLCQRSRAGQCLSCRHAWTVANPFEGRARGGARARDGAHPQSGRAADGGRRRLRRHTCLRRAGPHALTLGPAT